MSGDLESVSVDELLRRRGELAYAIQMAALEGLSVDAPTDLACRAVEAELRRRGVSPNASPSNAPSGSQERRR
ncbi:MAG: hypothetical protein A2138_10240 [Deltaproteobacteria bacterium RBG_16_71_12]|nr:MAG: hypothetical protein A2138_10240 [Deltaproteobacteria bacterium RBG_16_71_12]